MRTRLKNSVERFGFLVLFATLFWVVGCASPKPIPDPLVGFHVAVFFTPDSNKTITDDYKAYIKTLSPEEQKFAGPIEFFEDGTGQHAVLIHIGINGTWWQHVLIYDKDNKRIKMVKYSRGGYQS